MIVQGLVFKLLVGTREGHWEMESKRLVQSRQVSTGNITGKDRHFVGFLRLLSDVKEKLRR
jgi:hypothetical protein